MQIPSRVVSVITGKPGQNVVRAVTVVTVIDSGAVTLNVTNLRSSRPSHVTLTGVKQVGLFFSLTGGQFDTWGGGLSFFLGDQTFFRLPA